MLSETFFLAPEWGDEPFTLGELLALAERGPADHESMIELPPAPQPRDPLHDAWRLGLQQAMEGQEEPDGGFELVPGDGPEVPHYLDGFAQGRRIRAMEAIA